jgi:hypothetical protein
MAHFAKLNENNIVLEVLVVKNEVILDYLDVDKDHMMFV